MRLKVGILTICVLLLAACGPDGKRDRNGQTTTVTHGTPENDAQSPQISEYTDNGDTRVAEFIRNSPRKPAPAPQQPQPQQPQPPPQSGGDKPAPPAPKPEEKSLSGKLKEFQITRYSQDRTKPQQLGVYRGEFKLFFEGGKVVAFHGPFKADGGKLKFEESAEGFVWAGEIEDLEDETKGEFTLSRGQESAKVFYRAFKSKLRVRTDREKAIVQGSDVDQFVSAFRNNDVYGWVHSWVVIENGEIVKSTYLMDMVNNGPIQLSLSSTVGSEAWNSRDLKSRPH